MAETDIRTQRIGDILVKKNLITKEQLNDTLEIQKETGEKLGDILVRDRKSVV